MTKQEVTELFLIYKAALTDDFRSNETFEFDEFHMYSTMIMGVGDAWRNRIDLSEFSSPLVVVSNAGMFYQLTAEGRGAVRLMRKSSTQEEIRKRAIDLREELLAWEGRTVWKRV